MFNYLKSNILPVLLILVVFVLLGSDGRYRKFKTNAEVLVATNLMDAFEEQINFVPDQPISIVTDTILNSGFQVKINYHSIKNNYIEDDVQTLNNSKTFYNNFEANVLVLKNNTYCNDFMLNKSTFKNTESSFLWEKAVMQYVWIDFESSNNNVLFLNTTFRIPNTETYKDFIIRIDDHGLIQIKEKNFLAKTV